VPTLLKDENRIEVIEKSPMVAPRGKGEGHSNRGGRGGWNGRPPMLVNGSYPRELLFLA